MNLTLGEPTLTEEDGSRERPGLSCFIRARRQAVEVAMGDARVLRVADVLLSDQLDHARRDSARARRAVVRSLPSQPIYPPTHYESSRRVVVVVVALGTRRCPTPRCARGPASASSHGTKQGSLGMIIISPLPRSRRKTRAYPKERHTDVRQGVFPFFLDMICSTHRVHYVFWQAFGASAVAVTTLATRCASFGLILFLFALSRASLSLSLVFRAVSRCCTTPALCSPRAP